MADDRLVLDGASPPGFGLFKRLGLDPETRKLRIEFTSGGCEGSVSLLDGIDARVAAIALRELAHTIETVFCPMPESKDLLGQLRRRHHEIVQDTIRISNDIRGGR